MSQICHSQGWIKNREHCELKMVLKKLRIEKEVLQPRYFVNGR